MKRRVLVTAISGDVANGILKILEKNVDIETYGCDIYDFPVGMDKVKAWWKSDLAVSPKYIPNLIKKCNEYKIGYLIPVNEIEIKVISEHLSVFHSQEIKVMINTPEVIHILQDKYETAKYLNSIGLEQNNKEIHTPVTFLYDEYKEDGKEYIIKLRESSGSKFLYRIHKKSDIERYIATKDELVIQQYIPDEEHEYTVGVFSDGRQIFTIIFRRKLKHGYTSFVRYVEDEKICREVESIARYMNLHGYINVQLRRYQETDYIFEINARISGSVYFQYILGYDVVNWWLDLLDGKKVSAYESKYKKAIGIRELNEKYVILEEKD